MAGYEQDEAAPVRAKAIPPATIYEEIVKARGNLTVAAESLGITRGSLSSIVDSNVVLKAKAEGLQAEIVDRAEQNVFDGVLRGDGTDSRFVLQTLGKERGWAQGVAGTGKNGEIVVQINRLAPEEPTSGS